MMTSARRRSGKTSKPNVKRATSVGRGQAKTFAPDDLKKRPKSVPPSPPRPPSLRLSYDYEPRRPIAYSTDRVRIESLSCSQPVLHPDHPEIFLVKFTMEVRNLTNAVLRDVECRMSVRENWTIAVEQKTLQGNATIRVSSTLFASHLDGGYTITGAVSGVRELFMDRLNNYMTREFDVTHTYSRERREDSTLPHVEFG